MFHVELLFGSCLPGEEFGTWACFPWNLEGFSFKGVFVEELEFYVEPIVLGLLPGEDFLGLGYVSRGTPDGF